MGSGSDYVGAISTDTKSKGLEELYKKFRGQQHTATQGAHLAFNFSDYTQGEVPGYADCSIHTQAT